MRPPNERAALPLWERTTGLVMLTCHRGASARLPTRPRERTTGLVMAPALSASTTPYSSRPPSSPRITIILICTVR